MYKKHFLTIEKLVETLIEIAGKDRDAWLNKKVHMNKVHTHKRTGIILACMLKLAPPKVMIDAFACNKNLVYDIQKNIRNLYKKKKQAVDKIIKTLEDKGYNIFLDDS